MKVYFSILLFFLTLSFFKASASQIDSADTVTDLKIEQQQIIYQKEVVGKVQTIKVEPINSDSEEYTIQIFTNKGTLVAEYDVKVLAKHKKNKDSILSAELKTIKDNVVHNGSNFIDFHLQSMSDNKNANLLQVDRVVKYLLTNKYL